MKTKILSLFTLAAAAIGLSSCDNAWEPAGERTGSVSLSSLGVEVNKDEVVVSRAADDVDISQFQVTIYNAAGEVKGTWTYGSMPEIFTLPVAQNYRVEVISHELQKAEFGKPYYTGSKTFNIEDSKITDIGVVTCKFASIKVTVKFTNALREVMSDDVRVTVVANDEGRLEFTPDETRAGYFAAVDGSSTLVATFRGTVKGYIEDIVKPFGDVAAGQHRIITFDVKNPPVNPDPETGGIDPTPGDGEGLNVDVSYEDVDINEGYDNQEDPDKPNDRPGNENWEDKPDPNPDPDPDDPKEDAIVFDTDLSWDTPNAVVAGNTYLVTIKAPEGIAHLEVKIDSDNQNFLNSAGEMLPLTFDLAYPGDYKESFESIDLKTSGDVINATEVPFNITQLVPMLSGFPGQHKFTITVTDNKDNKLAKTLTFNS